VGDWTFHISLAIPKDDQTRLLVLPDGVRWRLPQFTRDRLYSHLHLLTREIHDVLGADMIILRILARQEDEEAQVTDALLLMDNRTPNWMPVEGARWIDRAELDGITLADDWMRPALVTALETLTEAPPAARPPWFQRGWFGEAEAWMSTVLTAHSYHLLRPLEQFKHNAISALLRAETTMGNVFFKVAVALPLFGHEPQLSAALGELYPDVIQAPLAIDAERRWMLTRDIGMTLRESQPSPQTLEKVVKLFARLQIDSASHIDQLIAVGCLDRRLDVLAAQIDPLLADEDCCRLLTTDEKAEWQICGDRLKELCKRLSRYVLPYTLAHGDFNPGNIALQGEQVRFFDWTDACITHPFLDLAVLINFDQPERAVALREAYLAEWTAYEPLERLREVYPIAMILGALHQAVSYQGIFNGIEADQQEEWASGAPFWARRVMQQLKALGK
jgi:hypothetical protein